MDKTAAPQHTSTEARCQRGRAPSQNSDLTAPPAPRRRQQETYSAIRYIHIGIRGSPTLPPPERPAEGERTRRSPADAVETEGRPRFARLRDRQTQRHSGEERHGSRHIDGHDVRDSEIGRELLDRGDDLVPDDGVLRAVVLELLPQLPRGVQRVVLDDDRSQPQDRVERDDVLRAVGQHQGDPVTGRDAETAEPLRRPRGERVQQLVQHVDFQRVDAKTRLTMKVPVHYKGEEDSPAVKVDQNLITHVMTELEVTCLPADLPEFIEVDLSGMTKMGTLHINDIKLPKGVKFVSHGKVNPVLASAVPPAAEEEPTPEEAAAAAAAAAAAPAEKGKGKKK